MGRREVPGGGILGVLSGVGLVPAEAVIPREHSVAGASRYKLQLTLNPVYQLEGS